ncbi:hypothetical protein RB598_006989 [Gaeumannomyces tritici]
MSTQPTAPGVPGGGMPPAPRYPFVVFGPGANCTLELCPVEMSVYGYRPSLAANYAFIASFALAGAAHLALGLRTRSWWLMGAMCAGCVVCILGYVGRIMLYYNPWSFAGFMVQIGKGENMLQLLSGFFFPPMTRWPHWLTMRKVLVGSGPVFFCAAIYVTLYKLIIFLDPTLSRLPPRSYIWTFLFCDVVALVLQATGGGLSTSTGGRSQAGVDMGLAGLAFQVATMLAFSASLADYLVRYLRSPGRPPLGARLRVFLFALGAATALILGRSAYRVEELSKGYSGPSIRNESLFIGLEGVIIVVAVFCLCVGHPGLALRDRTLGTHHNTASPNDSQSNSASQTEKANQSA